MRHPVLSLSLLLALLCLAPLAAQTRSAPSPLNASQDHRLARKVTLRSEAIPVSWVLKALSERSGVTLQVVGTAGDERLVAFVPEAPLAEVLERIADLYRLTWTRVGKGERPTYRLQKLPSVAREEQTLRDRALAQVIDRLSDQLRGVTPPDSPNSQAKAWAKVYPDLFPLLVQRGSTLTREGYIRLPINSVPDRDQARIVQKLTPILQEMDLIRRTALLQIQGEEIARGIPPDQATQDKPPSDPLQSTLTADLQLAQGLQASVGLRTNGDTWYFWSRVEADDLQEAAQELYADRDVHLPERPGATAAPPDANDPLAKVAEIRPADAKRFGDWIATLGQISDVSGVPIYSDSYGNYVEGYAGHPRAQVPSSGRMSVTQFLDSLCYPTAPPGRWKNTANSFWWKRDGSALIRSRQWIWESQTVLPAILIERVIASVRRTGALSFTDVPGLAGLTFFQLQQGDSVARYLDHWRRAVRVPAALSPLAHQTLVGTGIEWERLAPPDQEALARLLPGEDLAGFKARLRSQVSEQPAQGGTVLNISYIATPMRGARAYHLPLPGVAPTKGLPARGLEVKVR